MDSEIAGGYGQGIFAGDTVSSELQFRGADLCSCDGGTGVWTCLLNFSRKKRWKGNCSFFWGTAGVVSNLETGAFAGVFLYLIFGGF